ncbi:hypothetical protein SESBI_06525 [Sesbania bispinosa]|nr:hypothetical protein SESBI_06525 [Sesbania bispinosa]
MIPTSCLKLSLKNDCVFQVQLSDDGATRPWDDGAATGRLSAELLQLSFVRW